MPGNPLTRNQIIIIGAAGLLVLLLILLFTGVIPGLRAKKPGQLSGAVNFWGVFDSPAIMGRLIADYRKLQPKVEIKYAQINPDTYEKDLINALAGAGGPDLFMFHNTWLPKHFDKVVPLSSEQLSLTTFQNLYPTVIEQDFAPDGVIFALPLYLDTLALFYNKDLFDEKAVALPPKNWTEFQNLISRLREIDSAGKIQRAAAAIGGSGKSINRATDVLNLLMLQSGVQMVSNDFSRAAFAVEGLKSFKFYTQFANPATSHYTWNENLHYSLDNFAQEGVAMIFNYAHQIQTLKEKNPFLRFGIAAMPQATDASRPVNYANYWGLATSIKSQNAAAARDFALYLTTNFEAQKKYRELTNKPPALRILINQTLDDPELGVFSQQALTARSWPQIDNAVVENEFSKMIELVIGGRLSAERALKEAEDKITSLMSRRIR